MENEGKVLSLVPKNTGKQTLNAEALELILKDLQGLLTGDDIRGVGFVIISDVINTRYSFGDHQMPTIITAVAHLHKVLLDSWVE